MSEVVIVSSDPHGAANGIPALTPGVAVVIDSTLLSTGLALSNTVQVGSAVPAGTSTKVIATTVSYKMGGGLPNLHAGTPVKVDLQLLATALAKPGVQQASIVTPLLSPNKQPLTAWQNQLGA